MENQKIEEVQDSDYVIVFDPPNHPVEPIRPKKKKLVIFTGLIGLLLGFILAFIIYSFEHLNKEQKEKMKNNIKILFVNVRALLKFKLF